MVLPAWMSAGSWALGFTAVLSCFSFISAQNNTEDVFSFFVGEVEVHMTYSPRTIDQLEDGKVRTVLFNFTSNPVGDSPSRRASPNPVTLKVEVEDPGIAQLVGPSEIVFDLGGVSAQNQSAEIEVKGLFLGVTQLKFYLKTPEDGLGSSRPYKVNSSEYTPTGLHPSYTEISMNLPVTDGSSDSSEIQGWKKLDFTYSVVIIREKRVVDSVFIIVVALMVCVANIGMGCKIDLAVVKEVIRRPVPPIIGFGCQFIIMPLVSFGLLKALSLQGGQGLGFFATGCAPGGGASNMHTFLLDGDVSLSVTMTLISTIASLGMIPLWLFTLGQYVMDDARNHVKIPYQNILLSLIMIIIPVGIGILIQRYRPRISAAIVKALKPGFIFFIVFMFTFGVWTNLYIFKLFTPLLIVAGCLLPYIGFVLGGIIAAICRQPWNRIKTIGIETGVQNTGIPILLMKFSLPQPYADLSLIAPIVVASFTPIPILIVVACKEIRNRCCKKESKKKFSPITDADSDLEIANHVGKETNGNIPVLDSDPEPKEQEMIDLSQKKVENVPNEV